MTEAHLHRFGRNSGEEKLRAVRVPQRVVVEGGANGIRGSDAGYLAVLLHIPPAVDHTAAFLHGTRTDKGAVVIDVDHVDLRADAIGVECKWGDIVRGAACRGDILPLEIGTIGELRLPLVLPGTSEQRQRCAVQLDGAVTVVLRGSEIQLIRRAPAFLRRGIAASGAVLDLTVDRQGGSAEVYVLPLQGESLAEPEAAAVAENKRDVHGMPLREALKYPANGIGVQNAPLLSARL